MFYIVSTACFKNDVIKIVENLNRIDRENDDVDAVGISPFPAYMYVRRLGSDPALRDGEVGQTIER